MPASLFHESDSAVTLSSQLSSNSLNHHHHHHLSGSGMGGGSGSLVEDQRALQLALELSMLGLSDSDPLSSFDADSRGKKSQNTTECVPVPSSEHVAEIVGRQGKNKNVYLFFCISSSCRHHSIPDVLFIAIIIMLSRREEFVLEFTTTTFLTPVSVCLSLSLSLLRFRNSLLGQRRFTPFTPSSLPSLVLLVFLLLSHVSKLVFRPASDLKGV
jgi:hypothetical protein